MRLIRAATILLSSVLCACSNFDVHRDEEPSELANPPYGPNEALKGVYRSGFETSAIHLCNKSREQCNAGPDQACWVQFTETAYRQLSELRGNSYQQDYFAEVWLEGTGRIARKPGNFGHLAAYVCQVELTAVNAINRGPPWAFRPPPP